MKRFEFPCGCSFPIDESRPLVNGKGAIVFDTEQVPLNCKATWDLISSGMTKGVFQLESSLGKTWAKKLRPDNLNHLAALVALLRPGCLKSKDADGFSMTERYVRRKLGMEETEFYVPALAPILGDTYGVLVYQEQAMAIASQLAGFDLREADMLRKAIGKKDTETMAKTKKLFLEKANAAGIITDEQAEFIFGNIQKSQRYSFNKCTSFDTRILRPNGGRYSSRAPYTVEEMYRIRNDLAYAKATGHEQLRRKWKMLGNYGRGLSLCDDGRIRPNIIADIQPAGYHKVYKITLVNGATIRVTGNHKFPTNYGEMTVDGIVRMARLAPHKPTSLYVCGEYEQTDFTKYKWSEATNVDREKATGKSGKGANGPENRWYTNGSYTKFMEFKNSGPHCCFDCSADAMMSRIEVHHINGDRSNSEPENLMKLCASCHKKREYAAGRTKRGEKGYPAIEVSIERIEEDGECMTYDVTMGAPNHTFVVDSGIVTCNSHAVGYGLTSYHTAYAKAHFPLQFYTSYLYYAKEKQDPLLEIKELFNDAKSFDIKVLPPRFAELRPHFNTNGVVITFGLSDIKGIGEAQVLKMREAAIAAGEHLGKPCTTWSWYDFLVYFSAQIDSAAVKKMVESGAILHGDMDRQRMLAEFDAWKLLTKKEQSLIASGFAPTEKELAKIRKEQKLPDDEEVPFERRSFDNLLDAIGHLLEHPKGVATAKRRVKVDSIYKLLKNPPRSLKDSVDWVSRTEQQNLGVSLTCSRTSRGDTSLVNLTCKAYREGRGNDDYIVLGVTVEDLREVEVRTGANAGKKMAFVTVSDETGMLDDVTFFSDAWEQFSNDIFPGAPLMMQGKRDLKRGSFLVEKLWRL